MVLFLEEANRIIRGAIAKAEEDGLKISVAVCDAGGHLLAFNRMDGAHWASSLGSQGKARGAVAFQQPTSWLEERVVKPVFRGIIEADGGRIIAGKGAVPIMREGVVVGACGVGGVSADQDEMCALAGVADSKQGKP